MTSLFQLIAFADVSVKQYPDLEDEIWGIVDLCKSEIEEGGSLQHEISLAENDIIQHIEEFKKK